MPSRPIGRFALRLVQAQNSVEERRRVSIIGDEDVGADAEQSPAFPLVDDAGTVARLVADDGRGQTADLLGVFNLDVAVAEREQVAAVDFFLKDHAVDHHLFGEGPIIVLGAVDSRAEILGDIEEVGFSFDGVLVGSAGEMEAHASPGQMFEEGAGGVDEQGFGIDRFSGQAGNSFEVAFVEAAEIFAFIPERLARFAAPFAHALGQLNHLIDRLLAVQPHDVFEGDPPGIFLGFSGKQGQGFDEQGDHDLRPSLADQREGAVEVEQDVADLRAGNQGSGQFDSPVANGDVERAWDRHRGRSFFGGWASVVWSSV